MAAEQFQWVLTPGAVAPVGENTLDVWVGKVLDTNGPWTDAALTLSWDADNTAYESLPGYLYYALQGTFGHTTPGTYSLFFSADYAHLTEPPNPSRLNLTNTVTLVAVTNVFEGNRNRTLTGPLIVPLTAQMTPVTAGEFVSWTTTGGALSTSQGIGTTFTSTDVGEFTVTATCGSSSVDYVIKVPGVTAVSGPALVAVNDDYVFTATISHGPAHTALTWTAQDGAVISQTNDTAVIRFSSPGVKTVTAQLGTSSASTTTTAVQLAGGGGGGGSGGGGSGGGGGGGGAAAVEYQVPGTATWLPWTSVIYLPLNTTLNVRAVPDPDGNFPAGYPKWTGLVTNTGSRTITIPFPQLSTNATDFKIENVNCGHTVVCKAVVYEFNRYYEAAQWFTNRSTNHFAVGEELTLKVAVSPTGLSPMALGAWKWVIFDDGEGILDSESSPITSYKGPQTQLLVNARLEHTPSSLPGTVLTKDFTLQFIRPALTFVPYVQRGFVNCVGHFQGKWGIHLFAKVKIEPSDVSWLNIKVREIGGQVFTLFRVLSGWIHQSASVDGEGRLHADSGLTALAEI